MKAYKLSYLIKTLEDKGLTSSKPKIFEFQKKRIIPKGSVEVIGTDGKNWFFYTDEDIKKIVEILTEYGDKRRKQDKDLDV